MLKRESAHDLAFSPDLPQVIEGAVQRVRPFTMVPPEALLDLAWQVCAVLAYDLPGEFVECGVWRGGSSFLMAHIVKVSGGRPRKVWLFDSFEGLPSPEEIDGPLASAYSRGHTGAYSDNCRASLEEVERAARRLGLAPHTEMVKGWFDETLPKYRERVGPIAVLRIDADWHASVKCCLENLYDQVVEGGFVIFDDYHTYDGCAVAVHEFLGSRRLPHRLESPAGPIAVFRKGLTTWQWLRATYLTARDIAKVVPPRAVVILVDQLQLQGAVPPGRRVLPFLERDGCYWGLPPDDETAIREVERLRASGARFLVVAWTAFWWLDYYAGFHRYLRARARCIVENERVVVFDLRSDNH